MKYTCTLAKPREDGITDGLEAIAADLKKGNWIMVAPDGRMWVNTNPMILFGALASELTGYKPILGDQ